MAAPVFRSAGAAASGTAGITPGLPAGHVADDILLLFVQSSNETIAAPTGYVEVTNSPQGTGTAATAGSVKLAVFWKRDNGSESAPSVADSGNHTIAVITAFSGCITSGNPWDVTAGSVDSAATTQPAYPPVTTTVDNTCIVVGIADATDSNTNQGANLFVDGFGSNGNLDVGSRNTTAQAASNLGTGGGITVGRATMTTHGSIGTPDGLLGSSSKTGKVTIALKPPAVADTTIAGTDYYYTHLAGGQ